MSRRAVLFNQARDNRNLMMIDRDSEGFANVSAPLGSLDCLQAQSQEHMAAVTGIPLIVLLGITPSGLNATSEGELRTFYAWIEAQQEALFTTQLTRLLHVFGSRYSAPSSWTSISATSRCGRSPRSNWRICARSRPLSISV
ncbi:DUF1073 domain-containing protein [Trinickia violacea]|uniref:DUF1073 domain-containing protein n=1 Tax=Trinickia violacea TaxID=2571746 RepID=A0A4P8J0H4_9BURK|nr:anti-CBASS Acb1 family protein [Trinickia violacea]QCP54421.1 DUF1073 domain-containing protein [Trinickia violacea]